MAESVIRHRGIGYDVNGDPATGADTALLAKAVAPGATREAQERSRDGAHIEMSVFFLPGVDLDDTDELTVRGHRYQVQVQQWRSPRSSRTGTVALCSRGQG